MTAAIAVVLPLVIAAGLILSAAVLAVTRDLRVALPVLLDLLLVAGLLRLSADATWQAIASAALVVAIRKVVTAGLATARRARALGPAPGQVAP